MLYAKEVPERDGTPLGDTVFANTVAAYDALPEAMKRRLAGLQAIHRYAMRRRIEDSPRPNCTRWPAGIGPRSRTSASRVGPGT